MEIIFVCWKIYALKVIQTCPRELILDMTNSRWFILLFTVHTSRACHVYKTSHFWIQI